MWGFNKNRTQMGPGAGHLQAPLLPPPAHLAHPDTGGTPPAQRPLPALPVSPPPPQLPPRDSAPVNSRLANGSNCAAMTSSPSPSSWSGAPPPPRHPTTNLDDEWDSDDNEVRRRHRSEMNDLSDVMANLRPCESPINIHC